MPAPLAGRLFVLAAAILWSTSGLFAKAPLFDDWPADVRGPLLAFYRAAFAAVVLLPIVRRPRFRWELVPLAACFTGMNVTYLSAMAITTAANAIWLQSTAPWWVFLFGWLLHRALPQRAEMLPLVFAAAGVGLIVAFEVAGETPAGVVLGLTSGACYGAVVLGMRQLREENVPWLVMLNHAVVAAALFPWVLWSGYRPSAHQLLVLAAFGTFQMAIPYMLLLRGLRHIRSQEAVGIALVEPVVMPLWVFLVWGEVPAWWTALGAALIFAGLLLRYLLLEWLLRRVRGRA